VEEGRITALYVKGITFAKNSHSLKPSSIKYKQNDLRTWLEEAEDLLQFISLFILALAVSLDSFGVGVTYGMRKIRIPFYSILIIGFASAIMIWTSMKLGIWFSHVLSPVFAKWLGSILLVFIGVWAIIQVFHSKYGEEERRKSSDIEKEKEQGAKIISIEIKKLGLVIQIMKRPLKADIDRSGYISLGEAGLLGLALSLDAFGAGLGAALIGFQPMITALTIAGMSVFFILIGIKLGHWLSQIHWLKKFTVMPGIILILIGLMKIIKFI